MFNMADGNLQMLNDKIFKNLKHKMSTDLCYKSTKINTGGISLSVYKLL